MQPLAQKRDRRAEVSAPRGEKSRGGQCEGEGRGEVGGLTTAPQSRTLVSLIDFVLGNDVPLLTELGIIFLDCRCYRHGAPLGLMSWNRG